MGMTISPRFLFSLAYACRAAFKRYWGVFKWTRDPVRLGSVYIRPNTGFLTYPIFCLKLEKKKSSL